MLRKGVNKMPKCPGDCKELSKMTRQSTHNSNQTRTKPWPNQLLTSDNLPITKQIGTNDTPKCLSNLGNCNGLSEQARRWKSRNQGTHIECKLTSRTTISKQTKKKTARDASDYSNLRRRQETMKGPSSMMMWVWLSL